MTMTARPRNAAELAVLVPYQLGYHPGPCVILTAMHRRRIGVLQRHDLTTDPPTCRSAAQRALRIVAREGADAVLLMGFEDDEGQSRPLREAMVAAALDEGLTVREHLVVRDGRCHPPHADPSARSNAPVPPTGEPLPRPEDVPAVAPFVELGVCPLPSREHLVRAVLPLPDRRRPAAVAAAARAAGESGAAVAVTRHDPTRVLTWARLLDPRASAPGVSELTDQDLALVGLSLREVGWRDALLAVLCPGALPLARLDSTHVGLALLAATWCPWVVGDTDPDDETTADLTVDGHHEDVLAIRARLVETTRLLPTELTPPVLTLIAHLAWWSGDGTVTGICLERALQIEPDYRLADLMLRLLGAGMRPWPTPGQQTRPRRNRGSAA